MLERHDGELVGTTPPSAHVSRINTDHVDEYRAWITERYPEDERKIRAGRRGFEYLAESAALGNLTVAESAYKAATMEVCMPPVPFFMVCNLRSGRDLLHWQSGEVRLADRGVVLFPPYGYTLIMDISGHSAITLTIDTVLRVAEEVSGLDQADVRFTGVLPVSRDAERQWLATDRYVRRGIHTLALDHPLLLAAAEQLVAAIILATFPNTTMAIDVRTPRDPARAATVRRAIAFIDEHAEQPITLTDVATAVGVVPRTLQYAFRRHRDTTPLGYLRRVRLAQAHDELVAAQPGDGTTVAVVAARWGYSHPAPFAAAYRQVYGQVPSQTLQG